MSCTSEALCYARMYACMFVCRYVHTYPYTYFLCMHTYIHKLHNYLHTRYGKLLGFLQRPTRPPRPQNTTSIKQDPAHDPTTHDSLRRRLRKTVPMGRVLSANRHGATVGEDLRGKPAMPTLNLNAPTSPDISRFWCSLTLSFPAHFWFLVSTRLASARALEESQNTCRVTRPTRRSRRLRALAASGADDMKTPQRHRPRILEPDQLLILQESYLRLFRRSAVNFRRKLDMDRASDERRVRGSCSIQALGIRSFWISGILFRSRDCNHKRTQA